MNSLPDPSKKTSIFSLLNPQDGSAYPAIPNLGASVAGNQGQPHAHQVLSYGGSYINGSSFHLRAASWESDEATRRKLEESANANVHRHFHHHHSEMTSSDMYAHNHASRAIRVRMGDAPPFAGMEGHLWQPPSEPNASVTYSMAAIGPTYPQDRTALTNGFQSQSQSDSTTSEEDDRLTKVKTKPHKDNYSLPYENYSTSEQSSQVWQNVERVSVRLAARGLIAQSSQSHNDTPYPPAPYYSSPTTQTQVSYDPEPNPLNHPQHQEEVSSPPSLQTQPQAAQSAKSLTSKRQLPEDEANLAPKAKRPAKAKPKLGPDGIPVPSKRGYNAKKRSEAAQIAAQNAQLLPTMSYTTLPSEKGKEKATEPRMQVIATNGANGSASPGESAVTLHPELQFARCMSNRYRNDDFPRCVSCTRRWAGDTCRFQGIRYFLKDNEKKMVGISFSQAKPPDSPKMQFPTKWNVPLLAEHIIRTKQVIARALLPTLQHERKHLDFPELILRPRESDVRVTCDTCMTSVFSSSWMCRLCGREACSECFAQVRDLTEERPGAGEEDRLALQAKRDRHAHGNPFFLSCTKRNEHMAKDFSPMSRFLREELDTAIPEMERIILAEGEKAAPEKNGNSRVSSNGSPLISTSINPGQPPSILNRSTSPPQSSLPPSHTNGTFPATKNSTYLYSTYLPISLAPSGAAPAPFIPPNLPESARSIPHHNISRYSDSELSDVDTASKFSKIWAYGEPLLVTGVFSKFKMPWTPEYFIKTYGDRDCLILECDTDINKRVTIGEFFGWFGKYEGRTEHWKLKDWPPSTDFKSAFPELFKDFSQAVPVPDYVRRDGVYNIGSHFPSNTIGPDIGPKMYNSMTANLNPGGKGSTRLHMDMADALNVMTYAAPCADGSPGCAAWDVYRATDSDKIRMFLRKKYRTAFNYDPIHGQQYYLDDDLRSQLYQEYGVKSYRVYQRPGEAVFIPAGCAHQVANMSDCIKIAIDYVSPENISRCEKLTKEFREQNQSKVWKEDVLQLRTMMWYAWLSCCKQEQTNETAGPSS